MSATASILPLRNRILKFLAGVFLLGLLGFNLAKPINFTAVDIGRHIKNGELLLQGHTDILYKNFYSFTCPEYPFLNHHWLFGVMAYIVWKLFDFSGLSFFYIAVLLFAFILFFRAAQRLSGFFYAFCFAVLSIPLSADRIEIRPEGISLLFLGLYFFYLVRWRLGDIDRSLLFIVLPLAQLVWVNTHIFFFMGPLLTAIFLWDGILQHKSRDYLKVLQKLLMIVLLVNLINPSGIWGALTPLNIFKEFGYRLAENQMVFFMMKRFPGTPAYPYFLVMAGLLMVMAGLAAVRNGFKRYLPFFVLMALVVCAAIKAVRLISPFGFFFIPLGAWFLNQFAQTLRDQSQQILRALFLIVIIGVAVWQMQGVKNIGVGLAPGINRSAEFFKQEGLKGPVFSNYDIGGYLIYHLQGQEKVFVDNRQEAFPPEFFKKTYVPMQEDDEVWHKEDNGYNFNVIYFYRHDFTPWGQSFMIRRIDDPLWAPVFVDGYVIIFLKRNEINLPLIKHFELPRSMFSVTR